MNLFKKFHYTFSFGTILMTATISRQVNLSPAFSHFVHRCVQRHLRKDWGDANHHDKECNDLALSYGNRIISVYNLPNNFKMHSQSKIWIITEANRSSTTILFPSDY